QGRDYWHQRHLLADIKLPFARRSSSYPGFVPQLCSLAMSSEVLAGGESVARHYVVPGSTVLLGGWQVFLWRLTTQPDMVIGLCGDGRPYKEMAKAMGPYSCSLPLRYGLKVGMSFSRLLPQIAKTVCDACSVQEYFSWDAMENENRTYLPCFA